MDDPNTPYPRNSLLSLKTQGSTFLHEILHTEYTKLDNLAGLTSPVGRDMVLKNTPYRGRAYDPAKAKFLAKYGLGGQLFTHTNVDNYVYFAIWHYVLNRWDVKADQPPAHWPKGGGGPLLAYTDYIDALSTLPVEDYEASVNETLIDAGGFVDYGGRPCSTDVDCEGVCPPDFNEACDGDGGTTCTCSFTFDPQ